MESFNLFKCGESILNQLHAVLIKRKEHLFNKVDYRSSIRSDYYDNIVLQFPHQNLIKLNQDQTHKENQFVDNIIIQDLICLYKCTEQKLFRVLWLLCEQLVAVKLSSATLFTLLSCNAECAFQRYVVY